MNKVVEELRDFVEVSPQLERVLTAILNKDNETLEKARLTESDHHIIVEQSQVVRMSTTQLLNSLNRITECCQRLTNEQITSVGNFKSILENSKGELELSLKLINKLLEVKVWQK